jgi:hypothetical protein
VILPLVAFAIALLHVPNPLPAPPTGLTPAAVDELRDALRAGHMDAFGYPPSPNRLRLALAQAELETGRGKKMRGNNPGNLGASPGEPHYRVGGAPFRAFRSLRGGASAYWILLASRCAMALRRFDDGDPIGAGYSLHRCGFHRSDPAVYGNLLRALSRQTP